MRRPPGSVEQGAVRTAAFPRSPSRLPKEFPLHKRLALLAAAALAVGLFAPAPADAKSDRSRVAKRALKQSVRVEVQAGGKLARAASGVVIASSKGVSYVLTNAHVVQREGLAAAPHFVVVIERPRLPRVEARGIQEG